MEEGSQHFLTTKRVKVSLLIVSFMCLGIIGIGYFTKSVTKSYSINRQSINASNESNVTNINAQIVVSSATVTPSVSDTELNSYTTNLGISIKYPQTWYTSAQLSTTTKNDFLTDEKTNIPAKLSKNGIFFAIDDLGNGDPGYTADLILNKPVGQIISNGYDTQYSILTKLNNLTIAGYPAVEYTHDSSGDGSTNPNFQHIFIINKNNHYFQLTFNFDKGNVTKYNSVISQVINSLLFTK